MRLVALLALILVSAAYPTTVTADRSEQTVGCVTITEEWNETGHWISISGRCEAPALPLPGLPPLDPCRVQVCCDPQMPCPSATTAGGIERRLGNDLLVQFCIRIRIDPDRQQVEQHVDTTRSCTHPGQGPPVQA